MRKPETWPELTRIEPAFLALERKILDGTVRDYRQVHPEAFAWHGWDQLPAERLFPMLLTFLHQQLARARRAMPDLYGTRLSSVEPEAIRTPADWQRIPLLVKDDAPEQGLHGFRAAANQDPCILRPVDLASAVLAFGSGGSSGRYTPTFVTLLDRQREVQAWRRGHSYHGLVPGDSVLYSYNTTHKGGQWMQANRVHLPWGVRDRTVCPRAG